MYKIYILIILLCNISLHAFTIELNTAAQDSAPKYFLENNNMKGLCVDIMEAIEKMDPTIKFKGQNRFIPFKRIKKMLKIGELDLFFGFVKNVSREKEYIFIEPALYKVNHVVAVRFDDEVDVKSFDDIRKLGTNGMILTTFGTSTRRYLENQGDLIIDDGSKTVISNLKKLLRKRGRFLYYHNLGLVTSIKSISLENEIKILPTSFRGYSQYVAFSKKVPSSTITKVKVALEKLALNGKLELIFKKYSVLK